MISRVKKAGIWQFLRFCVVGTSNAVIDFGVLNLLHLPVGEMESALEP